uniref:Uncharacterized protein n=1 Tax=Rhizophora mucronata TaxID=61149 RepID=A0A2P2N334_RHIMU
MAHVRSLLSFGTATCRGNINKEIHNLHSSAIFLHSWVASMYYFSMRKLAIQITCY